ncbi:uncharacterized protein BDV14DRAFT_204792 [Aspergillus stella-maris]|uniref:uncharacterized protein n=1 Tax=Aspergillus stella-maris TaxID=1810926 RepID=UPI003CCCD167
MTSLEVKQAVRELFPELCERLSKTRVVGRHLAEIYQKTKDAQDVFLANDLLGDLGIQLSLLDFEAERHKEDPATFFQPIPESELPTVHWERPRFWKADSVDKDPVLRIERNLSEALNAVWSTYHYSGQGQPWVACKNLKTIRFTAEWSFKRPYRWVAIDEAEVRHETDLPASMPHLTFKVMNHIDAQDSLSRGEVLAITTYMEGHLKLLHYFDHYFFPIQVISMFHSGARILQAYHDGKTLKISMSKLYDLSGNDNIETYTLLARWMYSKPCGDTAAPLEVEPIALDGHYKRKLEKMLYSAFKKTMT